MKRFPRLLPPAAVISVVLLARGAAEAPHWSFQALEKPPVPAVGDSRWVRNPIDRFILSGLHGAKLSPNPEAARLTLIRRLTLDLTGLPPTIEEIEAFLADETSMSYENLVDRLLASPHYGERWGRHWLDVARYVQGRTKVPAVDRIDLAEPYRDYVVRALNADKPYDRFVTEQLAGDLLPVPDDRTAHLDQIAAPGFLSIGPWFADCADPNSLRMDIIDEQLSVTSQAFLGLNFGCARCHDHFFDPIPTRDYYALAGIFGSTRILKENSANWRDGRDRLTRPEATRKEIAEDERVRKDIAKLRADRGKILEKFRKALLAKIDGRFADYERALASLPKMPAVELEAEDYNGQNNVRRVELDGGMVVETQRERLQWVGWQPDLPEAGTYTVLIRCAAPESYQVELKIDGKSVVKERPLPATGGWDGEHFRWVSLGHHLFRKGSNDVRLWAQDHSYLPRIDKLRFVRTPPDRGKWLDEAVKTFGVEKQALWQLQFVPDSWPPNVADSERFGPHGTFSSLPSLATLTLIDMDIASLQDEHPNLPHMLAVTDHPQIKDEPVHVSGDVYNTSAVPVPRGVPSLAKSLVKSPIVPNDSSGRLQLAQWITDPKNPLTGRVIANRLWQGHFGTGIVATPGDLGVQGMNPTNQELLDWLAATLIEQDWSLKSLHRLIVTSATYRMSSAPDADKATIDPDNKLHWSYPRRRLEAEALYDCMMDTAGKLARQLQGEILDTDLSKDRALYILTSGRSPLGMGVEIRKMLHLFGYDPSGVPVHQRDHSVNPAQSLFWLNNKLPKHYATQLAKRLLAVPNLTDEQRINLAFRTVLGRPPGPEVIERTFTYLDHCRIVQDLGETESWSRVCLGLFSSDAFSYIE